MSPGFLILMTVMGFVGGISFCLAGAWLPGIIFLFLGIGSLLRIVREMKNIEVEE
jgi:lipopolysaccharide export LptBFGC system permease protein LptF